MAGTTFECDKPQNQDRDHEGGGQDHDKELPPERRGREHAVRQCDHARRLPGDAPLMSTIQAAPLGVFAGDAAAAQDDRTGIEPGSHIRRHVDEPVQDEGLTRRAAHRASWLREGRLHRVAWGVQGIQTTPSGGLGLVKLGRLLRIGRWNLPQDLVPDLEEPARSSQKRAEARAGEEPPESGSSRDAHRAVSEAVNEPVPPPCRRSGIVPRRACGGRSGAESLTGLDVVARATRTSLLVRLELRVH